MPCELEKDHVKTFPGLTLFSKPGSNCMKPSGVYLPEKHVDTKNALDVVLWLHGWYVTGLRQLFHSDNARVRQQVLSSSKDVVLIAPFLGKRLGKDDPHADYDVSDLKTAKWGELYLNEVLNALTRFQNRSSTPDLKSLVIACHSGGGEGMRYLVGTLGKYQAKLKECWGFDCLYRKTAPDDATFWYQWMSGKDARPLYIVYGPSTLPQSLKLDLIGRGKATPQGDKANPPGRQITDLHVRIGHYEEFWFSGERVKLDNIVATTVDDLMTRPPPPAPKGSKAPTKPMNFVEQAAFNLSANFAFVELGNPEGGIHFFIARSGFLSRLRNATFLV